MQNPSRNQKAFHKAKGKEFDNVYILLENFNANRYSKAAIVCGDDTRQTAINYSEDGCKNAGGEMILKFSKKFTEVINNQAVKGYQLTQASVNFVLYWKKPDQDLEIKIILPELIFECKAHLNQSPDN